VNKKVKEEEMPDIAASDVTITVNDRWIVKKKRYCDVTIAFGDAALTYPANGVPMPAASSFGMVRNLDYVLLDDPASGIGLIYKFDRSNKKVRIYEGDYAQSGDASFVELDSGSDAPAATTIKAIAIGW
jgi:hypothetical protein